MKTEKVFECLSKYIEEKMFPTMVNWQRVAARTFINRVKNKPELFSKVLPILNFFEYSDENGNIVIDDFLADLSDAIKAEGELEISIPMLGLKYKLNSKDVTEMCEYLKK
jgi:hypothetical protein